MFALFNSTEFWFGLVVLSAYQCGKFRELNLVDPSVTERSSVIPNLRASDFAGKNAYVSSLIVFLLATFVGYTLLCAASPTVLRGWFEVTKSPVNTADFVNKVPYPLYIAAAFMGLTQSAIPGFAALGDFQKNFFTSGLAFRGKSLIPPQRSPKKLLLRPKTTKNNCTW